MLISRMFAIPLVFQALSVIFPFVYLKLAYNQGLYQALSSELIQAIVGFGLVAIDFSAATFLAKKQRFLSIKGAVLTIISGRIVFSIAVFFVGCVIIHFSGGYSSYTNLLSFFLILFSISIDPTWIMVGRGKVWFPSFVSIIRFSLASVFIICDIDAVLSLGLSYFLSSISLILYFRFDIFNSARVKFGLYTRIIKNYYIPTLSEALTATFSRLDVFFAVIILTPQDALTYTLTRKIIIGFQSLAQSGSKYIYLYAGDSGFSDIRKNFKILCYLLFFVSIPVSIFVSVFLFQQDFNFNIIFSVVIMSFLVLATYYKTLYQFAYLYAARRFNIDIVCALFSCFSFLLLSSVLYFSNYGEPYLFASIRVFVDFSYIFLAFYLLRVR